MRGWLNAARWCLLSSRILPHAHAYPRLALASTSGRRVFMTTPASPSSFSAAGDRAVQVGLTGSIGMGKSTISTHFRSMGFPVFDADAAVHQLYAANGAAVGPIGALFPDAIVDGAVSRPVLGKKVMEDPSVLKALEAVVHPLVAAERRAFYEAANQEGHFLVVYDIPLLLENPTSQEVDYVVVATASAETQRRRVLERPGMTEDKFMSLLAKQMPDADKRSKADFLIHTDFPSLAPARAQVASVVEALLSKHATRWAAWKSRPAAVPVKAVDTRGPIAEAFDLVVFDLDDTLVPVFNPIKPATEALFDFMAQRMPRTAVDAKDQLRPTMGKVMKDQPLMAHDLTEVRREALRVLAAPHGEDGAVDEAMQVFLALRSNVAPHLYDDVLPCLSWLKNTVGVATAVLTNGNAADLAGCATLGQYLSLSLGAGDVGTLKPSPVPFMAISQRAGVPPSRVLFVGDSYEKDVLGAQAVGMTGALLLRDNAQMPADAPADLIVFTSLHPEEVELKMDRYLSRRPSRL